MKKFTLGILFALVSFSALSKVDDNQRLQQAITASVAVCGEPREKIIEYIDNTVKTANENNYLNINELDVAEMLYTLQSEAQSFDLKQKCKNLLTDYQVFAITAPKNEYTNHAKIMGLTLYGIYERAARQQRAGNH